MHLRKTHPVNSVQNSPTEASNDTHEDPTHSPPEWRSTWPSQTASAKSRANDEKVISDKTATDKAESENVVAESVSAQQVLTETEVVEKAAEEKVAIAKSSVDTTTVQQDVPRDVGPSAIGRKAKAYRILGWRPLASGLQMRRKTQVFRLLRTPSFTASHLRSYLSAMKARRNIQYHVKLHPATRNVLCSARRAIWSDRWNA